ncbi:NADP-dependent oxidoreductase [Aeromicrobium phragmitis]|uniref:NADP-dependent oxidoreductase n=1 Tax=Aeromicrobium phragmitis TaxID=2478914 RepID=A0A3L8PL61_9ACTN|nr:NADP-dependent oxidoreductase [Aeromicrobium phragmitis]RLV55519.1 NADP-dependent oxidoreductase [Aeromicrobium phragmitis]
MRAIGVTEPGGPEQLQVLDVPEREPGPGEVRIAVHAAAVNPTDVGLREGKGIPDGLEPPHIPGMDAAGVIDAIGSGVELSVGDRVAAVVNPRRPEGGAYAERIVVPQSGVALVPDDLDLTAAATVPLNGLTALRALDLLELPHAGTLAITGAAGGVGGYAVQLATARGYHVVADAKPEDEDLVRSLGADTVLPRGDGFADAVREAEPGGVDGLLDAALLGRAALGAVRDGGAIAAVRPFEGEADRGIRIGLVQPKDYLEHGDRLAELLTMAVDGELTPRIADTLPATQAAEAQQRLAAGGVRGRLVLSL